MKNSYFGKNFLLFLVLISTSIVGSFTSCSSPGSRSLPVRVVFTTEVHGYIEPCG